MAEIVTKWAAGHIYKDSIVLVKGQFRKTAKLFIAENPLPELNRILGYVGRVSQDTDLLHDTWQEALDALMAVEDHKITVAEGEIADARNLIEKIVSFATEKLQEST